RVSGMKCPHCEARVEKQLSRLEGVVSVKASHADACVELDYDPAVLAADEIVETIADCGYEASL
ncbi:MAG: heavy-metal-associated domain-containing protein, partial [Bacteroidales bacterium]|nr:heavy-metal-associated domain-containing protein [Bacteroidales bacterium]